MEEPIKKQRHWFVSTWLILMIILNSLTALLNLFSTSFIDKNLPNNDPKSSLLVFGILGLGNILFAIMLLKRKIYGFYGFVLSAIIAFSVNIYIEIEFSKAFYGLIGIGLLYGILQIRKDGISAWRNLD